MSIDADSVRTVAEEVLMEVGDDTFSARQLLEAIRKNKTAEATINYLLDNGTGIESARQTDRQLDCITDAAMTGARMQSRVVSASRSRYRSRSVVWCGVVCTDSQFEMEDEYGGPYRSYPSRRRVAARSKWHHTNWLLSPCVVVVGSLLALDS